MQAAVSTFRSPFARPLRVIDPTVTFTSAALVRASSTCAVYFNGNCVHRESTPMQVNQTPDNIGYVYRVSLVPGFWQKLCESNGQYRHFILGHLHFDLYNQTLDGTPSCRRSCRARQDRARWVRLRSRRRFLLQPLSSLRLFTSSKSLPVRFTTFRAARLQRHPPVPRRRLRMRTCRVQRRTTLNRWPLCAMYVVHTPPLTSRR